MNLLPKLTLVLALAAPLAAQGSSCSDLTVSGDGTPGTTLSFAVTGSAADAFTFLLVGDTAGTTALPIPLGMIEIGLATPFVPLPLGLADANGDVSLDVMLPPALPSQVGLFAQSIALDLSIGMGRPTLTACTSDVEGFNVGTAPN